LGFLGPRTNVILEKLINARDHLLVGPRHLIASAEGLLTTPMTTKRSILMVAFAALGLVAHSASGFCADAQRGKRFAGRVCATCHVVFKGQSSGDPNAPSFQAIAKSRQFRETGVRWLWEVHPKMLNLATTQEELDDLAAYIKSIAK
jgi:mono/diheme cytochrome c family protein